MPECLNNFEGIFPFYYDPRYDQALNPFEPGTFDFDSYLQDIIIEVTGVRYSPEKLLDLKRDLDFKGLLNRNVGDPSFRDSVKEIIKKYEMARKVAFYAIRSK